MRQNILVCFFRFTVPIIAVHLQNANAKFHKKNKQKNKQKNIKIMCRKIFLSHRLQNPAD